MRHIGLGRGLGGLSVAAALVGLVVACNGVLGIGSATVEPLDTTTDSGIPADAGAGGDADPLTCANYCAVITKNCTGVNEEYLSPAICLSMCPFFDFGMGIADSKDDTLGCRIFNANAAATDPEVACRYAGPLGGGHCGPSPCKAFCGLDLTYCTAPANPVAYPGGETQCETECAKYPYLVADAGDTTTESGNTLNCRLWHLETAYTSPAYGTAHCLHTGQVSATCF